MTRTLFLLTVALSNLHAAVVMFGGNGGQGAGLSINDGWLVTIDQTTGAVTTVGHPANVSRISGLAFDLTGALFATTLGPGGFPPPPGPNTTSNLLRLNPATGAIVATIGVTDSQGGGIAIADLAVQPGTGTLFGIRAPVDQKGLQGRLYTIDKTTGVATLVGDTGDFFGSIAFAPNGTLYMSSEDMGPMGPTNSRLKTLNPTNASTLLSLPTAHFFGALGVRPDGVLFGGDADQSAIFTINPVTGAETFIGSTSMNLVGDLDFQVPEPGTLALLGLGLCVLSRIGRKQKH
jgi:PEP-CTERM motif